ncbi:MAG: hypothetical protein AAFX94_26055, partial [Myxococcota bacterium]
MRRGRQPSDIFAERLDEARHSVLSYLADDQREALKELRDSLTVAGPVANEVVELFAVDRAIDIASVSKLAGVDVAAAAEGHRIVGETTGLLSLVRRNYSQEESMDETPATYSLRDRIRRYLVEMAVAVVGGEERRIGDDTLGFLDSLQRELVPFQSQELSSLAIAADRLERAV